jgi:hypothetical protein
MDDFIIMKSKNIHPMHGMKNFILEDVCFLHFSINNEIIHRFWDSVKKVWKIAKTSSGQFDLYRTGHDFLGHAIFKGHKNFVSQCGLNGYQTTPNFA